MRAPAVSLAFALLLNACGGDLTLKIDTPWVDEASAEIPAGDTLERSLAITAPGPVMQGTVEVILEHPAPDDLQLTLTSAAGTGVPLPPRIAEGGDDYRYALPLLAVQGEPANGTWRLRIDATAASAPGTLIIWGVEP